MDKFSTQEKNHLFAKIQEYVKTQKFTLQNMVDLHDILTADKPSYSHNNSGTLYMASKYSDETFEKIQELVKWVEKQHTHPNIKQGSVIPQDQDQESLNGMAMEVESNDDFFGKDKKFKNTFGGGRFKLQKVTDVTKSNEMFKRVVKVSKKRCVIPIHHQEKGLTSWEESFNHKRTTHFSDFYMSRPVEGDDKDGDEEGDDFIDSDEDEDEEEEEEENAVYERYEEEEEDEEEEVEEESVELVDDEIEEDGSE